MQAKGNRFIRHLVGYVVATLALFAGSLAVADSASAEDDVLWVDLDFYGQLSTTEPLNPAGYGTYVLFRDGQSTAQQVNLGDFGEAQLRLVSQQVDDYYNRSTDGRIRFRFRSWHPFDPTSATECSSSRDVFPAGLPVPHGRRVEVILHAEGCIQRVNSALAWLGMGQTEMYGEVSAWVLAHETGHNLGLHHASTAACMDDPLGDCWPVSSEEYGTDRGVMGTYRGEMGPYLNEQLAYDLTRTRPLDPGHLLYLGLLESNREVRLDRPPTTPRTIRLNPYWGGGKDVLTLMGADSRILTLTYQSDPSMSDKTPVGVEVYLVKGGLSTSRQGPAPLALGEIYGGDMGYAVQVTRITPEYAEIVVSDAGEPLTAPADLTTTAAGRSVQLTWIPPTGRTVLGVEIERRWRSGPETLYRFTADEITSWSDSSATVSSVGTYWYRVRLKTTQGYTPFTDFSAEVITADLPGPVTSAEVHPVDKGVVVRPQCTNGGAAITSHQVRYTHDLTLPVDQWETASVSADYDSAMKGLQNGQTYALQIACSNDAGTGPFSQTYYVTPSDPPQAPVVSRYMVDSDVGNPGYVRLWVWLRAAPGSEANSSRFRVWLDGEDYRACIRRRGDSEPCVINKLTPKQPYSLHLVSIDDARTWGPRETKIIKAVDPPTAPSNVRAEAGHGTASLSWSPSRANLADVITYEVRDESDRLLCDTTETQCSITLPEQGAWTVTITAFNDGVASPTTTFQGVVQGNPPPPDPPVSPPPPDPPVSPPPPDPPVSPPPTTQPPSTPPPTDPTGPPTPPPTGNPGSKPAEGPGAGSGHADPILGGGVPSTDTPSDIVRLQTIRKPRRTVRVGTTWKVPKRTLQGQRASWKSAKTSVCTVKKGKRLVFRKRGKCIVSVTAPSTLNLTELRKTFTVRVKSRR